MVWWLKIKKPSNAITDRRLFSRIPLNVPLRFLEKGGKDKTNAQTVDLSANGMGFITTRKLATDTELEMWLDIPDNLKPLYIKGKIVWSKRAGLINSEWRTGVYLEQANLLELGRIYHEHTTTHDQTVSV